MQQYLTFKGDIVIFEFSAADSGNSTGNLFLSIAQSLSTPNSSEIFHKASVAFYIIRFIANITTAGTQALTMIPRINTISQASLSTIVGPTAGTVITDLSTPIAVAATDSLSVIFTTGGIADASLTRPRAAIIGILKDSY